MSIVHSNGVRTGESVRANSVATPDPYFIPGNSVFGNRYARAFKLRALEESDAFSKPGELGKYLRQKGLTLC